MAKVIDGPSLFLGEWNGGAAGALVFASGIAAGFQRSHLGQAVGEEPRNAGGGGEGEGCLHRGYEPGTSLTE